MQIRKKSETLEAIEYTGANDTEITDWIKTLDAPLGKFVTNSGVVQIDENQEDVKLDTKTESAYLIYDPNTKGVKVISKSVFNSIYEAV